jgi:voltage-gated potassium channel
MWWAVQTVTTVGYGDAVPTTLIGQLLAALVMLLGIGFVTVITASITGAFVARSRTEQPKAPDVTDQRHEFERIHERLERIEAALRSRA